MAADGEQNAEHEVERNRQKHEDRVAEAIQKYLSVRNPTKLSRPTKSRRPGDRSSCVNPATIAMPTGIAQNSTHLERYRRHEREPQNRS